MASTTARRIIPLFAAHWPPHVHVLGAGAEAVFNLIGADADGALRTSQGFSTAQLNRIADALGTARAQHLAQWERIHDHYRL